ncbi:MAG: hypothetical protein VB814_04420 [Pirellulaceae bacterium]
MLARGVSQGSILFADEELGDLDPEWRNLWQVVSACGPRMAATDTPGTFEAAS